MKTICTDEDVYGETCQWTMLRTVVTLKNLCVKYQRAMIDAEGGAGAAGGLLGGYNPIIPNVMGSFVGDI